MEANLRVEIQCRAPFGRRRQSVKNLRHCGRPVDRPADRLRRSFDSLPPERQTDFLPAVDGLPTPNQCDQNAPTRDALTKLDQVFRFGHPKR